MELLEQIRTNAQKHNKRIVLPEGEEYRTLKAANQILSEKIAQLILIGNSKVINQKALEHNLEHIIKAEIIDPVTFSKKEEYAKIMVDLRKHKGVTTEKALEQLSNPYYLGTLMIKAGDADGLVAGAICSTADTIRPAFQYIKTAPGRSVVSGAFIMIINDKQYGDNGTMVFADCAVNPNPNEKELAEIAVSSAETARKIAGIEPKVAMLSFSTNGSANHPDVDKIINALQIAKKMKPELQIGGELQADAALVEKVAQLKAPKNPVAGKANVLVFPTLDAGNIGYKLVQRLAGAQAIGPVLQGLAAPINDLSRGCSSQDIVNLVAITANQAID